MLINCLFGVQTFIFKETDAFSMYNKALSYQKHGDLKSAEHSLRKLLDFPYIKQVSFWKGDNLALNTNFL